MSMLKKVACDFWGLNEKHYRFHDENGKPIQQGDEGDEDNQVMTVDKHFETSGAKQSGSGAKVAVLFMGREKNNEDLLNAFKQIKEKLKLKNAAEKEEENANNDFNENEEDM